MLILVLIDVQYLQNVGFCIEKDSDAHNHFLSDSHHLITLTLTPSPQFFQRMLKFLNYVDVLVDLMLWIFAHINYIP